MFTPRYKIKLAKKIQKEKDGLIKEFHHHRIKIHKLQEHIKEHDTVVRSKLEIFNYDLSQPNHLHDILEKIILQKGHIRKIKSILEAADLEVILNELSRIFNSAKTKRPKHNRLLDEIQHRLIRTLVVYEASTQTLDSLVDSLESEKKLLHKMIAEAHKLERFKGVKREVLFQQHEAKEFTSLFQQFMSIYETANPKGEAYLYKLFKDLYDQIFEDIEYAAEKCKEFLEIVLKEPGTGFVAKSFKRVIYFLAFKILPAFSKTGYYILLVVIALRWDAYRWHQKKADEIELTPKGVVERYEELERDPEHQKIEEEYENRPWWRVFEKDPTVSQVEDEVIDKVKREGADLAEDIAEDLPNRGVMKPVKKVLTISSWLLKHSATMTTSIILFFSLFIRLLRKIVLLPYHIATFPIKLIGKRFKRRLLK